MSHYQDRVLFMIHLFSPSFFHLLILFFVTSWEFLHVSNTMRKYTLRFKYESSETFKCSNPPLISSPWILEIYLSILSTKQRQICSTVKWSAIRLMTFLYWMVYKHLNIQKSFFFARVKLNNPCYVYKIPFVEK